VLKLLLLNSQISYQWGEINLYCRRLEWKYTETKHQGWVSSIKFLAILKFTYKASDSKHFAKVLKIIMFNMFHKENHMKNCNNSMHINLMKEWIWWFLCLIQFQGPMCLEICQILSIFYKLPIKQVHMRYFSSSNCTVMDLIPNSIQKLYIQDLKADKIAVGDHFEIFLTNKA